MEQKIIDLMNRVTEKEEEYQSLIEFTKILLLLVPDETLGATISKKLDKAYKHRVKSDKRLMEVLKELKAYQEGLDE